MGGTGRRVPGAFRSILRSSAAPLARRLSKHTSPTHFFALALLLAGTSEPSSPHPPGPGPLPLHAGLARYKEMAPRIQGAMVSGSLNVTWAQDGASFEYVWDGELWRYDLAGREAVVVSDPPEPRQSGAGMPGRPKRGRQFDSADSPDGTLRAFHRDRNLWISDVDGIGEIAVTTEGSEADNNVHPSNTLQLIAALQEAGKHFQVQVGPDRGHAGLNRDRMMEFFMESLVLGR